jgi:hypothetical protein
MNAKKKTNRCLCLFAGTLLPAVLNAGWVYEMEKTEGSAKGEPETIRMYVQGDQFAVEDPGGHSMIYDRASHSMKVVDHGKKSYTVIDKAMIERMNQRLDEAMAQYQQALEKVPAAQRGMMERMMKERMPHLADAEKKADRETSIRNAGEAKTIGGYRAMLSEYFVDGEKKGEFWTVPWDKLEGSEEVAAAFKDFSGFMDGMMKALSRGPAGNFIDAGGGAQNLLRQIGELEGFPVLTRTFGQPGNLLNETVLKGVESRDIEGKTFRVPDGYKRNTLDFGG